MMSRVKKVPKRRPRSLPLARRVQRCANGRVYYLQALRERQCVCSAIRETPTACDAVSTATT